MILNKEFFVYENDDNEHCHVIKLIKNDNEIVLEGYNTNNESWVANYRGILLFSISFNEEYLVTMKTDLIDVITLGDMLLLKNMITLIQMIDYDNLDIQQCQSNFKLSEILKSIKL